MTLRCAGLLAAAATMLGAEPVTMVNLMPWPAEIAMGQGSLAIGPTVYIAITGHSEPRLQAAALRFGEIAADPSTATLVIHCEHASEPMQQLGEDESYRLEITTRQA